MAACDRGSGELLGVCFVHPRPTHVSVGIVAVAPRAWGRGIARAMLTPVLDSARSSGVPVRLVSSLLNLDSFSLYSRLGFVPHTIYQDVRLAVPPGGLPHPSSPQIARVTRIRDAGAAGRLAECEARMQGMRREQDYALFLENRVGDWRVWACEADGGQLEGFLVAGRYPGCAMIGPAVARNEATAIALLWRALDEMRGEIAGFLVPTQARVLVRQCYDWGARNVELHAGQTTGAIPVTIGVALPTFLPETA